MNYHEDLAYVFECKNEIWYFSFQVQNFGEPFFLVVRENETLTEVKQRIQKKLMISDDEFSKVSVDQFNLWYFRLLCVYMGLFS